MVPSEIDSPVLVAPEMTVRSMTSLVYGPNFIFRSYQNFRGLPLLYIIRIRFVVLHLGIAEVSRTPASKDCVLSGRLRSRHGDDVVRKITGRVGCSRSCWRHCSSALRFRLRRRRRSMTV